MSKGPQLYYPTIAQSEQVTSYVALKGADLFGLWCPTITSCNMFLQGSFDTTSANFVRALSPVGSASFEAALGVGSLCIALSDAAHPFPYVKLESSVVQTNVRTFVVVTKF